MNDNNLTKKTITGMIWKFAEKIGAQLMQIVIQIVLARLLIPEEYGLVGLLTIFITISDVFILQGLTTALIQKKDVDEEYFSSVFFANIAISIILYVILYSSAPFVAEFYKEESLTSIMRILLLNIVIGAFGAVHNAILSRNLDFKKSFIRNMSNTATQGVVGIGLALNGFGAWSMVLSKLSGTLAGVVVLWITMQWKPKFCFSISKVKTLFRYSSKILGTNLLNTIFNNIHSLIIGRYYTAADVGYYQRGQQIPQALMSSVEGSMTEVLYPAFSTVQDNIGALKNAVRRSIKTSMYVILPAMMGLCILSEPLTILLLTEKWLPSVPFMRIQCIICMFWPLSHRSHALNAMGRSDVTFKLSVMGKIIMLVCIFAMLPHGIYALMLGTLLGCFLSFGITSYYTDKYFNYTLRELLIDLLPSILATLGMGVCVWFISKAVKLSILLTIILQVIAGVVVYILISMILKIDTFYFILYTMKTFLQKKRV